MTNLSIAVIGGGIGGLSAALSLLQAGHDVHVHEQSSALSEVGAGIQISPNASKALHGLGLAAPLAAAGGSGRSRGINGAGTMAAP
jgi:salicylate hydroxylase